MVLIKCANKNIIVLDEGLVRIFAPFRFIQKILGSCRIDVKKDGIVTPPTVLQKCYTVISLLASVHFYFAFMTSYAEGFSNPQMILKAFVFVIIAVNVTMSLSIIHARFCNNEGNVRLYIKMWKIDNLLKISSNATIRNCHYKHNLVTVLGMVIGFTALFMVVFLVTNGQLGVLGQIGSLWAFYSFVFELISCSSHIVFFTNRVRLVNSIITNHFKIRMGGIDTLSLRCASTEWEDFDSSKTDLYDCMKEILSGFACFEDQYRFQILLFFASCLTWLTTGFQYAILLLQRTSSYTWLVMVDIIYLGTMAITNIGMLLWICVCIVNFISEVKKTKKNTIHVLSRCVDGPLRQKAKKMFKLIDETPPSFSVYGMWRMDARVSLSMFQIVTSTYVIILQFAFP